jgi:hypothetical protein
VDVVTKPARGREEVGPPGGPTVKIPSGFTVTITGHPPYDMVFVTAWDPERRRLVLRDATFSMADREPVRMASLIRIAIAELTADAMETAVLGERGWAGIVQDHPDTEPERVDALVYLLSVALGSPKPSANVAIARGLSPASGAKRVGHARKAGLLPETESGVATAGLSTFQTAAKSRR